MLLALETIISDVALSTNQVKSNIPMGKYGTVQGSYAVFHTVLPTPATHEVQTQASNACYNQAEKLQAAGCDSHSLPKRILQVILMRIKWMTTTGVTPATITDDYYSRTDTEWQLLL